MDANDPCRSAYLPSSKSIMGLARIERAKPLFVQTLDVVGAFTTASVPPFLLLTPGVPGPSGAALDGPNLLCTRPDVYIESWGYAGRR